HVVDAFRRLALQEQLGVLRAANRPLLRCKLDVTPRSLRFHIGFVGWRHFLSRSPAHPTQFARGRRSMKLGFTRSRTAALFAVPLLAVGTQAAAQHLTHVPFAIPRIVGVTLPTALSPELQQIVRAQGSVPVENPGSGVAYYGYRDDHPNLVPVFTAGVGSNVEASKTEPDKNTYLVLEGQHGADADYDYGRRFLYQGHEGPAALGKAYITRINLDADAQHRVTVLATKEADGVTALLTFDGSTWYPWSDRLLFTAEG